MQDPLIGTTLAQYELQAKLGHGGMAAVYQGFQPSLGRAVAVKVLPLNRLLDPTLPARFRREARLAASLMHPNIVPVFDFGEWDEYLFIVMALVSGGTLKERLDSPLPVEAAVRLVGQIADALGFAHGQGVYHRDVKPTNVLLASADWAMLGDFGIARALGETTRLTSPYGTIGTPAYMAPEQWLGGEIDGRADLYALGAVLFELLAGSAPFTATTSQGLMRQHLEAPIPLLASRNASIPAAFDDVIQMALAKQPEHRYQHTGAFKAALEAAALGRSELTPVGLTNIASWPVPPGAAPPFDPTMRVPRVDRSPPLQSGGRSSNNLLLLLLGLILIFVVILAGGMGYLLAGGRLSTNGERPAASPTNLALNPTVVATSAMLTPATPTLAPATGGPPAIVSAPATAASAPTQATKSDPRFSLVEGHIADYFEALNAQDYPRAQAACCTPRWRAQNPLDDWAKNFTGVTDLRFATPIRHVNVEPNRIVSEVDYSFTSRGARRFFTLRWTFVPSGQDWLADDAQAFPQRS